MYQVKYPKTCHLPWSLGVTNDDKVIETLTGFIGKRVIISEKRDGENTSLYKHTMHARSIDSDNHPSRAWVKQFWNNIRHDIPEGWRICGENLYAKHSIWYKDLNSYFEGFSIWNENNTALSWDSTLEWFSLLGVRSVPILYDGLFDEKFVRNFSAKLNLNTQEGYVIRTAGEIQFDEFKLKVAKYVRANHVTSNKHWKNSEMILNKQKPG